MILHGYILQPRVEDVKNIIEPDLVTINNRIDDVEMDIDTINNTIDDIENATNVVNLTTVGSLADFPTPVDGVITLLANNTYLVTTNVDLLGNRLYCEPNVCIIGISSENCKIYSTDLDGYLITSENTLVIRHITLTADYVLDLDGLGNTMALDWFGVNFKDCLNIGIVKNFDNFLYQTGAFLNSTNLVIDGEFDTLAFTNCLLSGRTSGTIVTIPNTAICNRRIRFNYSSFVVFGTSTGLNVSVLATIPTESYILDTCNFSGGSTYLAGIEQNSNISLFSNCVGVENTSVNAQLYMQDNVTPTTISTINTWVKVQGTTIPSDDNRKYSHSNNRLTNQAKIARTFTIQCTLSYTAGVNNVCTFGFFDSKLGIVRIPLAKQNQLHLVQYQQVELKVCILRVLLHIQNWII